MSGLARYGMPRVKCSLPTLIPLFCSRDKLALNRLTKSCPCQASAPNILLVGAGHCLQGWR